MRKKQIIKKLDKKWLDSSVEARATPLLLAYAESKFEKMSNDIIKIMAIALFTTIIAGCGNRGGAPISSSINLQTVLNEAVNSAEAKNEYITGIPLTFQCNGSHDHFPLVK
ncbi:MAG: hypothetical protein K0R49_755 [Burkholderiales bacterium]|nr:hypothetical protein [Burkholderiales bacterium]